MRVGRRRAVKGFPAQPTRGAQSIAAEAEHREVVLVDAEIISHRTVEPIRGTIPSLRRADVGTLCLRLFKIGAVTVSNTRRARCLLSSISSTTDLNFLAARRLAGG